MHLPLFNKPHHNKIKRILLHVLFWFCFFGVQYYIGQVSFNSLKSTPASYLTPLRVTTCLILVYYPLVYLVIPKLIMKRRWLSGTIALLLLIVFYTVSDAIWEIKILEICTECRDIIKRDQPEYYGYMQRGIINISLSRFISLGILYQLIVLMAVPLGFKLASAYIKQRVTALQLAKENAELEFNLLKAQVNPHFLFNTLNNIYALIGQDRKQESAETVARLSSFMRYSIYKEEKENTIGREIALMKDYIELEKIRLNNTIVNFNYDVDDSSVSFPPLLFIPLIENAFKYCVEETGKTSWILVQLNLKDKKVFCRISNTCNNNTSTVYGGIGLNNVKKRLEQYYPGEYAFDVKHEEEVFTATIQINPVK